MKSKMQPKFIIKQKLQSDLIFSEISFLKQSCFFFISA